MGKRKQCKGRLEEDFISDYLTMSVDQRPCALCRGTGVIRTGPHRLTDGTWSDGIDRSEPLGTRDMHYKRWEVWKNDWRQWLVAVSYPPFSYLEDVEREFPTHTEAIAYADRMARTNQGENNGR